MSTATMPPTSQSDSGRAFTKRLRWAGEFQFLALFAAILGYCGMRLHQQAAVFAHTITHSLTLQVAICWLPLWAVCTASVFPVACYTFRLQRKFGLLTGGVPTSVRGSPKVHALAVLLCG